MSVYIVAAKRTAIGSFMGKLSKFKAPELGGVAIRAALASINVQGSQVDEIIMGNVCQAMVGQNPARQASIYAGVPVDKPCTTINKVCASGMKAIMYGSQSIQLGQSNIVIAGGFESMSNVPFYVPNYRKGHTFGNQQLIDGLAYDGLTDVYNNIAMGLCAEKTVNDLQIDREVQDQFTIQSYERTIAAIKAGKFFNEIADIEVQNSPKDKPYLFNVDEEHLKYQKEKIPQLKAVFSKTGTITAGNASKINDAGAALILASEKMVKQLGLKPLARVVSYADSEVDPIDFCIAPQKAVQLALQRANMKLNQIDYHEINEAFAATALANMKLMDLDPEKVNVHGGAISMGHPIGFSGARIVLSLQTVLRDRKGKYGVASICNGGGGASAIIIENLQ